MNITPSNAKLQSDKRQFGGLLMLLGFCAMIMPLPGIVSGFGPDGANTTDASTIPFWGLFGGLCLFITGVASVFTGYLVAVHDWSHRYLTLFLMVAIQTAWIGYITDMTSIGKGARVPAEENTFIPQAYSPKDADVKFVGAMGIIGVLCYGFAFAGAVAFMAWSLHAYNTGTPQERSGDYFQGRLSFYSLVLATAGLVQFMLGCYCAANFDSKVLSEGPVGVAFLIVTYPSMSILVGLIQIINGLWGILRAYGWHEGPKDISYQVSLAFQWLCVLVLQIVSQIAYIQESPAQLPAIVVSLSLGLTLMPAYLDHKQRTLPLQFPENYYYDKVHDLEITKGGNDTSTASQELPPVTAMDPSHLSV